MKSKLSLLAAVLFFGFSSVFAQINLPRDSQRQSVSQVIGDTTVAIVYNRPNTKGREVWGKLVPYNEVWRTGANENTTFEVSNEVKINGQTLPAGKYGLHTIPTKDGWTVIFNKINNEWGSFNYDAKQDQLRVSVKPQPADFQETMLITFDNVKPTTAEAAIRWEKLRVPFTIDVGDVNARVLENVRTQIAEAKADDYRTPLTGASWIMNEKMTANYTEAMKWIEKSLAVRETFGGLNLKAQMLAATGKKAEAIAAAEKAIQVGKAATPAANTANLEKMLNDWKASK